MLSVSLISMRELCDPIQTMLYASIFQWFDVLVRSIARTWTPQIKYQALQLASCKRNLKMQKTDFNTETRQTKAQYLLSFEKFRLKLWPTIYVERGEKKSFKQKQSIFFWVALNKKNVGFFFFFVCLRKKKLSPSGGEGQ